MKTIKLITLLLLALTHIVNCEVIREINQKGEVRESIVTPGWRPLTEIEEAAYKTEGTPIPVFEFPPQSPRFVRIAPFKILTYTNTNKALLYKGGYIREITGKFGSTPQESFFYPALTSAITGILAVILLLMYMVKKDRGLPYFIFIYVVPFVQLVFSGIMMLFFLFANYDNHRPIFLGVSTLMWFTLLIGVSMQRKDSTTLTKRPLLQSIVLGCAIITTFVY